VSASTDGSPHGGALNNSGIQEITKRLLLGAGGIIAGRNKEPQNGKAETYMPLKLPVQAAVSRELAAGQGYENSAGVEAAQSVCNRLTGLAQQMCYASLGGGA
jgi:hypothetical protein